MAIRIHITPGSPAPIYVQIIDCVRTAVVTGDAAEGDALPSVRSLAAKLVVNANTVAKAYAELCRDGIAVSARGRGVFIAAPPVPLAKAERLRRLRPGMSSLLREAVLLGVDLPTFLSEVERQWPATTTGTHDKKAQCK